jgi:hypothetical protein
MKDLIKIGTPFSIKIKNGTENHIVNGFLGCDILAKNPISKGRDIQFSFNRCIFPQEIMDELQRRRDDFKQKEIDAQQDFLSAKDDFIKVLDKKCPVQFYNNDSYLYNGTYHKHILRVLLDVNKVEYTICSKYGSDTDVFSKVPKMSYYKDNKEIVFTIGLNFILKIPNYLIDDIKKYFNLDFNAIINIIQNHHSVDSVDYAFLSRFLVKIQ